MEAIPANRLWRQAAEEDSALDEEALKEVEDQLVVLARQIEKYSSPAWAEVFDELRAEQQQCFSVMMSTDDEKLLLTAREKARVIASITNRKERAERELAELSHQRQVLAGEAEEEEEN